MTTNPWSADPASGSGPTDPTAPDIGNVDDPWFLSLVEKLAPAFAATARAAVDESMRRFAEMRDVWKPATVTAVGSLGKCSIRPDGDVDPIAAQVIGETPMPGQRVMACFVPPSSVFVIGALDGFVGVPPGTIAFYQAPIEVDFQTTAVEQITPPFGWIWAHGQIVNSNDYPLLYQRFGRDYNDGSEDETIGEFRVPDYRGRIPLPLDDMGGTDAGRLGTSNTLGDTGTFAAAGTDIEYMLTHVIIKA